MPADALSRVFSALADPTRRDLVARLAVADATVGELAEPYAMSVQAVSKHLKVLQDARNGGSYRYIHSRTGQEFGFHGSFHEVRPNELIVQTFTFEGFPDSVALEKLTLEDLGNGRTRLTATSLVDSFADRDAFVASG